MWLQRCGSCGSPSCPCGSPGLAGDPRRRRRCARGLLPRPLLAGWDASIRDLDLRGTRAARSIRLPRALRSRARGAPRLVLHRLCAARHDDRRRPLRLLVRRQSALPLCRRRRVSPLLPAALRRDRPLAPPAGLDSARPSGSTGSSPPRLLPRSARRCSSRSSSTPRTEAGSWCSRTWPIRSGTCFCSRSSSLSSR